jgi:hypothetical protein
MPMSQAPRKLVLVGCWRIYQRDQRAVVLFDHAALDLWSPDLMAMCRIEMSAHGLWFLSQEMANAVPPSSPPPPQWVLVYSNLYS